MQMLYQLSYSSACTVQLSAFLTAATPAVREATNGIKIIMYLKGVSSLSPKKL
jgi:hypothetical protein